jgi:hypothetical protein
MDDYPPEMHDDGMMSDGNSKIGMVPEKEGNFLSDISLSNASGGHSPQNKVTFCQTLV